MEIDLPIATFGLAQPQTVSSSSKCKPEILTETELQQRDRENLLAALTKTDWRIYGPDGAAELLGVKPTTLISRIKKCD